MSEILINIGGYTLPAVKRAKRDGRVPSTVNLVGNPLSFIYIGGYNTPNGYRQKRKGQNPSTSPMLYGTVSGVVNTNYCYPLGNADLCVHIAAPNNPFIQPTIIQPTTKNIVLTYAPTTMPNDGDTMVLFLGSNGTISVELTDDINEVGKVYIGSDLDAYVGNLVAHIDNAVSSHTPTTDANYFDEDYPTMRIFTSTTNNAPFTAYKINGVFNGQAITINFVEQQ